MSWDLEVLSVIRVDQHFLVLEYPSMCERGETSRYPTGRLFDHFYLDSATSKMIEFVGMIFKSVHFPINPIHQMTVNFSRSI